MKILRVNSLSGIKNQMYSTEQYVDPNKEHKIINGFFDINSLFWSEMFKPEHVSKILSQAKIRFSSEDSPKVVAVLTKPKEFFETYVEALKATQTPVSNQVLFQSLETLEIICYLYSKLYTTPFSLSIASGFIHSKFSAKDLSDMCLLPLYNPYLHFIESKVIPSILEYNPKILIITGKPNIASFAIAKLIKEKLSDVFICASENESDYYSMRKIKKYLSKNTAFFSVYHCAILGNSETIIPQIEQVFAINDLTHMSSINNIIYSLDNGVNITQTPEIFYQTIDNTKEIHTPNSVINVKAFANNHCYWNKCTFCGINAKYFINDNLHWDINTAIKNIESLYINGVEKIWFLDEAIPVEVIANIAKQLISKSINITWHIRTRLDPQYTKREFVKMLKTSGLKHILFGFESASPRILELMNKYDFSFNYIEVAEKVVKTFEQEEINVHFSAIIGIPGETKKERQETIRFLTYMKKTYSNFSYNVNSFYLDIGSPMYKRWASFDISSLSFPCSPRYFLDNQLDWNSYTTPNKQNEVQKELENLMFQQYSWYPKGALITPSLFYSFWEYSRYCLYETSYNYTPSRVTETKKKASLSRFISFSQINSDEWLLYNLKNHQYVMGGSVLKDLANNTDTDFSKILQNFDGNYKKLVEDLISNLTRMDFFDC